MDCGVLVGLSPEREFVDSDLGIEAYKLLGFGALVFHMDFTGVYEYHFAFAGSGDLGAAVADNGTLEAGADDRSFRLDDRNSLTHHVTSHQRTVGIVMLQERDQRCGDR